MDYWDTKQKPIITLKAPSNAPVSHCFTAGALFGAEIATDEANGVVHWSSMNRLVPLEISVDLKVLWGRVLDQVKQSNSYYKHGEYELQEPIQIQRYSRDKHLGHSHVGDRLYCWDPRFFHRLHSLPESQIGIEEPKEQREHAIAGSLLNQRLIQRERIWIKSKFLAFPGLFYLW